MKTLQISSVPLMELIQKACETLVVINTVEASHIFNVNDRKVLLAESKQANEIIDHIRTLLLENKSDASNPKS